jgi:Cell shape-determining protein
MNKKSSRTYMIIFFALLGVMSIPKASTERLQGATVAFMSPIWNNLLAARGFFQTDSHDSSDSTPASSEELLKLKLENSLLRKEIVNIKNIMQHELDLLAQMENLLQNQDLGLPTKEIKDRHRLELLKLLQIQLQATPARVIFRSPSSWNSSLWINVGSETNSSPGQQSIVKNSPVLLGTAVIGVIDYVGKKQSRVRLITDSGLNPSVRASRGEGNNLLAKGEIHGSSKPLWRTQRHNLAGIGFNYDFSDEFGPARDLRTGKPIDDTSNMSGEPIIQAGDVLVTTGLDGVFPAGLPVAEVTRVHPLKEGDYYYALEAMPVVGDLDELTLVFVIPPVGYDQSELSPSYEWH